MEYDKNLCNYIVMHVPEGAKLLEVAIGTGYPFGNFFNEAGYQVYGIDIAPLLINKCQQLYPDIKAKVGDAEDISFPDSFFECTYCFHSSWYFPNLNKAIDEMLRVTCPGGLIIFDIQNRNNQQIEDSYLKNLSEHTLLKRIIRKFRMIPIKILRPGTPDWGLIVHEIPTYPEDIYNYLKKKQISDLQIMVRKENDSIETSTEIGSFKDYARLVFAIRK